MSEIVKKGFFTSVKGFLITFGLPIIIVLLVVWVAFKLPGSKFFQSLVNKSKKKKMEEKHRKTMVKIEKNKAVQDKLREEVQDDNVKKEKNKKKIEKLEQELKDFEKKVDVNKGDISKLDAMADDLL